MQDYISISHLSRMQIFDEELAEVEQRVRLIAAVGADAVIVQVCASGLFQRTSTCHEQVLVSVFCISLVTCEHVIWWPTCCTAS